MLALRRAKGMVLDPDDPDTYSAGSFFTNPILDAEQAAGRRPGHPRALRRRRELPVLPGQGPAGRPTARPVKLSAAWLIERAGFAKGYPGPGGRVAVSSKHTLALTNRGGSTADLIAARPGDQGRRAERVRRRRCTRSRC